MFTLGVASSVTLTLTYVAKYTILNNLQEVFPLLFLVIVYKVITYWIQNTENIYSFYSSDFPQKYIPPRKKE